MPITLPTTLKTEAERPQGSNPWLWLVEIEISRGTVSIPPVVLRTTSGQDELQWPIGAPGTPTWYPFPFTFTPVEQNQEGDLPQLAMSVDNTTRMLMRYLHDGAGLEGNSAIITLVTTSALGIVYPNHEYQRWEMRIADVAANETAITLRLQRPNFLASSSPADRYVPARCRWDYGGSFCGYVLNGFAAFQVCPKTIIACIDRGADMIARGYGPNVLPANYGGHPGLSVHR